MNVLHLNQSDIQGGAAIAAYRLHQGLREIGVNSRLLVPTAVRNEDTTTVLAPMTLSERALLKLTFKILPNNTNLLRSWKMLQTPAYQQADILHFHNLHTGLYFNYLTIPRIAREKPVVYTLHDMWAFTGHCSYSYDCERWLTTCGKCPYPDSYPAVQWDNTAIELRLKKWVYAKSKMTIVTPSHWLSSLAQKSILGQFPIHTIPNSIDTDIYQPQDKAAARHRLSLPQDKIILMFASADLDETRKGMDILLELLKALPSELRERIALFAMGRLSSALPATTGLQTFQPGYLTDDLEKASAYAAADLFISTTRADNLPLVLQESMACGTPMLATRVGGTEDLVRQGLTGFTAPQDDLHGLSQLLIELIQNANLRRDMATRCRQVALEEYAMKTTAQKYVSLYENLKTSR